MRVLPKGNYIAGSFMKPAVVDGYVERSSPADRSDTVGKFPESLAAVDRAVEAARGSLTTWRNATPDVRVAPLRRFQENLDAHRDRLANVIVRETGKPMWEATREVDLIRHRIDITLEDGLADVSDFGPGGASGLCRYRPIGVMAVLGPFNFPAHLPAGHFIPALATGCSVVWKPSSMAPGTGQVVAEIIDRSKFPRGVFNVVQGMGQSVGAALARHEDVDIVAFTGSRDVGRRIAESVLGQDKMLVLEMGGKNSTIVLDDADLERAAHEIVLSAFITAGQRCTCTSRVLVAEGVADALVDALRKRIEALRVGYPFDDNVFCGPLVSRGSYDSFLAAVAGGREEGAEPVVEGGAFEVEGREGYYVRPSLHRVAQASFDSVYQTEEHFGPDLHVLSVRDVDEAIAINSRSRYGLALSVFTQQRILYDRVRTQSREGAINWNRGTVGVIARLPFGGTRASGNYRATALHAVRYCTHPVTSIEDDRAGTDDLISPPGFGT